MDSELFVWLVMVLLGDGPAFAPHCGSLCETLLGSPGFHGPQFANHGTSRLPSTEQGSLSLGAEMEFRCLQAWMGKLPSLFSLKSNSS